ncbi:type II secretion system protein [Muricoccus pecuniae]|uniref:Type II secretory pathway component PulJ n=1 Tax=Muricoccus pecuniae TaxID=693023 RepID=A0A840YAK1_9PROT|nr:type II secretion system protein [Roseomonas pecuniae]MBB5693061.1 type II secretory pathway component PulJ [Roseomonas pecuniae]
MCARFPDPRAEGFTLVEALVALLAIGGAVATVLPTLGTAMRARAEREGQVAAALMAQSLLDAHAPPGAAREGRHSGRAPEGAWSVEVGPGEPGAAGTALRPVRVTVGGVVLETLRPGPAGTPP